MLYIFIFIFLLFCIYRFDIQNNNSGKNANYIFAFLVLVSMSSLRFRMGGDGLFYDDYYDVMPTLTNVNNFINFENDYGYQIFWVILNSICKTLSSNVLLFHIVHSLILNIILFMFIKQYSLKPFSVLMVLFVTLMYFYYSFEIQRESLAVVVFLINIKNLEQKKWIKYYLLATLSLLFHLSAVIVFILPFFNLIKLNKSFIWSVLIGSFLISIFRTNLLSLFNTFLVLDSMVDKANVYSEFTFSLKGFLAYYLVRVILFIPLALYLNKEHENDLKHKWFYSAFFTISVLAQFFVGFERFLNYLFPLYFVIIIEFIYNDYHSIISSIKKNVIILTMILHLFFILDYKLFIINSYGQHYYSIFFPYNSIFDSNRSQEREDFYDNQ